MHHFQKWSRDFTQNTTPIILVLGPREVDRGGFLGGSERDGYVH